MNDSDIGNSFMSVRYKLVFVGDVGVGKTSIMNRFITDQFSEEYDVIIKIYNIKIMIFKKLVNHRSRFCHKNNRI
jgi:GTPase SAR1 family protein